MILKTDKIYTKDFSCKQKSLTNEACTGHRTAQSILVEAYQEVLKANVKSYLVAKIADEQLHHCGYCEFI